MAGEVTAGLAESNGSLPPRTRMTYSHLRADCLYTGISYGPNARYRVWEAVTFKFYDGSSLDLSVDKVRRSVSQVKVQGHMRKVFLFRLKVKVKLGITGMPSAGCR